MYFTPNIKTQNRVFKRKHWCYQKSQPDQWVTARSGFCLVSLRTLPPPSITPPSRGWLGLNKLREAEEERDPPCDPCLNILPSGHQLIHLSGAAPSLFPCHISPHSHAHLRRAEAGRRPGAEAACSHTALADGWPCFGEQLCLVEHSSSATVCRSGESRKNIFFFFWCVSPRPTFTPLSSFIHLCLSW